MWCNKHGLSNILSLSHIQNFCILTYYRCSSNVFILHIPDSHKVYFLQSNTGIYCHDAHNWDVVLVNTVEGNKQHFTKFHYE